MKSTKYYLMIILGFMALISCERDSVKRTQAEQLARDAYSFGYPLVLMDTVHQHALALSKTSGKQAKVPMYQFYHTNKVREVRFRDMASLDNDMIYSTAWLDLGEDPVVLTVPASANRYFVGGFLQGWSDIFAVVGTRVTGGKKQRFLISGPQWKGKTPSGMKNLRSGTDLVWLPIRIDTAGGAGLASAKNFQQALRLTPLSQWGKNRRVVRMVDIESGLDLGQHPRDQVFAMNAEQFYTKLCALMIDNPPMPMDSAFMEKLRALGIFPTKQFNFASLLKESQRALTESVKGAKNFILSRQGSFSPRGRLVNGWTMAMDSSDFGTDYHRRAYEAYRGLGALPPQDAVFPVAYEDNKGQQLMGENSYKITFQKGNLPPVNGFWSINMYHLPDVTLIQNMQRRYSLGKYNRMRYNPDGSLSLLIQPTSPGKEMESNWLPSGRGNYQLTLKLYWPKKEVLEGRWSPPAVERIEQPRMTKTLEHLMVLGR